jgi:hypothetical protein
VTVDVPAQPDPGTDEPIVDEYGRQWRYHPETGQWTFLGTAAGLDPKAKVKTSWSLRVIAIAWALALVFLAYWSVEHGRSTVREQSDVTAAEPTVSEAISNVLAIVGPEPIISISDYRKITGCVLTKARDGAVFGRTLHIYTPPGTEVALLDRIATGLPARYHATVAKVVGSGRLTADAGDFVKLRAAATGTGDVEVIADTGCRPLTRPDGKAEPTPSAAAAPTDADRAAAAGLLAELGTTPQTVVVHQFGCIRTVETVSPAGVVPGPLDKAFGSITGLVIKASDRVAFRAGGVDTAIVANGDTVAVTRTNRC